MLSAKVYFDNVKYEDALKILQCAEPYKVSFQVKRTIPGAEVSVRPRVPSVDVKGPKAKITKMVIIKILDRYVVCRHSPAWLCSILNFLKNNKKT